MPPLIYADLRSLQDPRFQFRGVGNHIASVLRQRMCGPCASWKLVGLVDDELGELPPAYAALVDEISRAWNAPIPARGAVFLDLSPMTHDPRRTVRFIANGAFWNAAIIYDFIPLDWPTYLSTIVDRIEFLAKVARLRAFDAYLPISEYSASRLSGTLCVPASSIHVTGAAVRESFFSVWDSGVRESPYDVRPRYFLTVGGGDRRKNTEAAVSALRVVNQKPGRSVALRVVGHYDDAYRAELQRAAGHKPGNGFLEFWTGVEDKVLQKLYAGALATICPSHIEGFDLPVVESVACGTPVIASTCGSHMELVGQTAALFHSDDYQALAGHVERILQEPEWREQLWHEQAPVAERFRESEVGARFWNAIATAAQQRDRPRAEGKKKPAVAFLSPYPPDQSGVARYTQLTLDAGAPYFRADLYTDAARPLPQCDHFRDAGMISRAALWKGSYDSIISVVGNSHFHIPVLDFFEQHGGPCILHDSRLTHIYHYRLGPDRFRQFAASILGREVSSSEIQLWLRDRELPSLFIEPILKAAKPLIVHTRQYQSIIKERYGVQAEVTAFCPNMLFSEEEIGAESRALARQRLGISPTAFLVATFGFAGKEKGMDICIAATEMLRGWNVPAELHFVGDTLGLAGEIRRVAQRCGVDAHVHMMQGFVEAALYRDYMLAADAAVQLRAYGLGQPSAALVDCISAGLPSVSTDELAASCDAPAYIVTVPTRCSPLHVAEGLATVWEGRQDRSSVREQRQAYLASHNFDYYARRLIEILELT